MTLLNAYRRGAELPEPGGSPSGLLKYIEGLRGKIRTWAKPGATPTKQQLGDLSQYEVLVQGLAPLLDLSGHVGYQQWRGDVFDRLDADLRNWPEKYLRWVSDGHSAEQLLLASAIFASTQAMGRRMFAVVDGAIDEKARHDRYQEKAKAKEAGEGQ